MNRYMSKSSKILITAALLLGFVGVSAGSVTNLGATAATNPTNGSKNVTLTGDTDNAGVDIAFRIEDAAGYSNKTINFTEGDPKYDRDSASNAFRFEVDLGDYNYTDGSGNWRKYLIDGTARVKADAGTTSFSGIDADSTQFEVDNQKPDVIVADSYVEQTPLSDVDTGTVNFYVNVSDDHAINTSVGLNVNVRGFSGYSNLQGDYNGSTWWRGSFTFSDSNESASSDLVVSGVEDAAGNVLSLGEHTNNFTVDTDNPNISFKNPNDGDLVQTQTLINGTASDSSGINPVQLQIENPVGEYYDGSIFDPQVHNLSTTDLSGDFWEYDSSSIFDNKVYDLKAIVVDSVGNYNSTTISFERDNQQPVVDQPFNQPVGGDYVNGVYQIQWDDSTEAYDRENNMGGSGVDIEASPDNGSTWESIVSGTSNDGSFSWDTTQPKFSDSSEYILRITLTDLAGNTNANDTAYVFTVDNSKPSVSFVNTTDSDKNSAVDGVNVTFSEPVSSTDDSDFKVENRSTSISGVDNSFKRSVYYSFTNEIKGTSAKPHINFSSGAITDLAGNNLPQTNLSASDKASPVLMHAELNNTASTDSYSIVSMSFSEKVYDGNSTTETVNLSGKALGILDNSSKETINVNYSEVLDTSNHPNVTVLRGVQDDRGNLGVLKSGEKVDVDTFRRQIASGWNYVSFPIGTRASPDISEVFPTGSIDSVWVYRNGNWSTWEAAKAPNNPFDYVRGGVGYLVKANAGFPLHPNVENKVDGSAGSGPEAPTSLSIEEGWNLLGQYQEFRQGANSSGAGAFDSLGSSLGEVRGTEGSGTLDYRPLTSGSNLKPGYAYWVSIEGDLSDGTVSFWEN